MCLLEIILNQEIAGNMSYYTAFRNRYSGSSSKGKRKALCPELRTKENANAGVSLSREGH